MSFLVSCKTAFWTINLNKLGNERKIRPLGNVEGNIIQIENYSKDILIILFYKNLIIWKTNKILKQIESAEDNVKSVKVIFNVIASYTASETFTLV